MDSLSKRLFKELTDINSSNDHKTTISHLAPIQDDSLLEWKATLLGQEGTPYDGGHFDVKVIIPKNYPFSPPQFTFLTPICHPNIHFKTGEICLDILKSEWSPAWTLKSTCMAIALLLDNPEPSSPLNCDCSNLLSSGDVRAYNSLVRMYTTMYAKKAYLC